MNWLLNFLSKLFWRSSQTVPPIPAPIAVPQPAQPAGDYFARCVKYTMDNEGGFTNDPNDAGGATNYGITIGDLSRYLGRPASVSEVQFISQATAIAIYKQFYWDPLDLSQVVHPGSAAAIFDQCVLCGLGFIKEVQKIVGTTPDGHVGALTLNAIDGMDQTALIQAIEANREAYYQGIVQEHPADAKFLRGWENRDHELETLEAWK